MLNINCRINKNNKLKKKVYVPPQINLPIRELSRETIRLVELNITEIANKEESKNETNGATSKHQVGI